MADKKGKYLVQTNSLTAIANAIRTKTGGSSELEFPTGFVNGIGSISGDGDDITNSITFIGLEPFDTDSFKAYIASDGNLIMYGVVVWDGSESPGFELPYQGWNTVTGGFIQSDVDPYYSYPITCETGIRIYLNPNVIDINYFISVSIFGCNI